MGGFYCWLVRLDWSICILGGRKSTHISFRLLLELARCYGTRSAKAERKRPERKGRKGLGPLNASIGTTAETQMTQMCRKHRSRCQ